MIEKAADRDGDAVLVETPPENPHEAIVWWRIKDPSLTVVQIAGRVGRSERTVRRILEAATAAGRSGAAHPPGGGPTNGAVVQELAESVASST